MEPSNSTSTAMRDSTSNANRPATGLSKQRPAANKIKRRCVKCTSKSGVQGIPPKRLLRSDGIDGWRATVFFSVAAADVTQKDGTWQLWEPQVDKA